MKTRSPEQNMCVVTNLFTSDVEIAALFERPLADYRDAVSKYRRDQDSVHYKRLCSATESIKQIFCAALAFHASKFIDQFERHQKKLPMNMKAITKRIISVADCYMRRTIRASSETGFIEDVITWVKEPKAHFLKVLEKSLIA